MSDEISRLIQTELLKHGSPGLSVQIGANDAVAILESFYEKGRADSERELRISLAKQNENEFITKAEAMKLLGKSENTLWKWNQKKFLCYVKRGGSIYYKVADIQAIMNGVKTK